jgi:DeoR/GlpR family transcriptional regulator of sugar metabolism
MYQQERMDCIMKILYKFHYATVEYLVAEMHYSPASIRRDLTLLEKQGLVTRSYGGVTLKDANASPFRFRQHSMKVVKNAICKKAAMLVKENDVVFLDGSSTIQYMGHFLHNKKGITVITCNMLLANFLSEHGVDTYCTGGRVVEYPGILGGQIVFDNQLY